MPITTECPHCGKLIKIADSVGGKKVKCPKCEERFRVSAPPPPDDDSAESEQYSGKPTTKRKVAMRDQAEWADQASEKACKINGLAKESGKSSSLVLISALGVDLDFRSDIRETKLLGRVNCDCPADVTSRRPLPFRMLVAFAR